MPQLAEMKCLKCGAWVEVFVKMGGAIGEIGTLTSDEACTCGYILPAGNYENDYELFIQDYFNADCRKNKYPELVLICYPHKRQVFLFTVSYGG